MANGLKQDISIGENLKRLRKQAGLTQGQASAKLELLGLAVTPDILAKMEQGKYSIRISVLAAMKDIYHADSFDAFFDGVTTEQI